MEELKVAKESADENMITTVIRNLVMNGIKFSNVNKNIYLSVSENDKYYTVSVKAEGNNPCKSGNFQPYQVSCYSCGMTLQ